MERNKKVVSKSETLNNAFESNNSKVAIFGFEYTGNMAKPWAENGYACYLVDMQHPKGQTREGNIIKIGCDIRDWLPPRREISFASFSPPCTDVAVSGSRWFKDKGLGSLVDALQLFDVSVKLAEWCECAYIIENPVSTVSSYWRKPDYTFNPCDYGGYLDPEGDHYTKRTCLWTGGDFVMPPKKPVEAVEGSKMHLIGPSPIRANLRSAAPLGFAYAVYYANKPREVKAAKIEELN